MGYTLTNLANNTWFTAWVVVTMLLIWVLVGLASTIVHRQSPFSNPNDTQYANRFQAGPDGVSLNDRMVAAQAKGVAAWQASQGQVSTLTGSRDVPVFFQDYDIDMQQKGGNIYNQREGFGEPTDCGIPGAC
jgi:hypothetical protein